LKRLIDRESVRCVFRDGQKIVSPFFAVFFLNKQSEELKYAVHIRKKFGIAVERNHAKRLLRAALYELREKIRAYHVILIPRRLMKTLPFWQIVRELENIFSEAELVQKKC